MNRNDRVATPVKSADRVLLILEALTDATDGLTLTELQQRLQIPKSSAYGLLTTMAQRGFLVQNPATRRFQVGIRLWQAGRSYLSAASIEKVALPHMEALRDQLNETVELAILDGTDNVYIAKVDPDQQLRLASHVGARLPAYATGIGKALLSQLSDAEIRERFDGVEFVRWTSTTLPDLDALLEECARTRERGFAVDHGEYTAGVYCIAHPLRQSSDHVMAALSVSIPEVRKSDELIEQSTKGLKNAARQISQRFA